MSCREWARGGGEAAAREGAKLDAKDNFGRTPVSIREYEMQLMVLEQLNRWRSVR